MPRKTDKRVRLIEAAKSLMHEQGFNLTTLADIAQEAEVPLGNVYYYFKTKEAIGEAVIDNRIKELHERLFAWDKLPNVTDRLLAMLHHEVEQAELIARFGCPIGGLCQELAKQGGSLADAAAKLLNDTIEWVEKQFKEAGLGEKAKMTALEFVGEIQGMCLLTNTFKDPKLMMTLTETLEAWLKNLIGQASSKGSVGAAEAVQEPMMA